MRTKSGEEEESPNATPVALSATRGYNRKNHHRSHRSNGRNRIPGLAVLLLSLFLHFSCLCVPATAQSFGFGLDPVAEFGTLGERPMCFVKYMKSTTHFPRH